MARFIGSPPINLVPGTLACELPQAAMLLEGHEPASVILGVRPADIEVLPEVDARAIQAEVQLIEPTGSDLRVAGEWRGQRIRGRASPDAGLAPGRCGSFKVPLERVYLFSARNGTRLR